jgi:NADH:ubiquinone oxidoreductase subunit 6 (subunit J)
VLFTDVRTAERQGIAFETLGNALFAQWAVPFAIASLVLLVALIGAVVMVAGGGDRE